MTRDSDFMRNLGKQLKDQGWSISFTKGGHIRFESPSGRGVISSATPGDHRTRRQLLAELRREGADV